MMRHGSDITKFGSKEKQIIRDFNKLWHESIDGTWHKCTWMGVKCIKCPFDLWIYQELICQVQPELILETGTCFGGSALFMAHVCDLVGKGKVVTIDIRPPARKLRHSRLEYMQGHSTGHRVLSAIRRKLRTVKGPVMAILDSDHKKAHVLNELKEYSQFVTPGSYLIVEDTNLNGDVRKDHGPGPKEALEEWLPTQNGKFVIDPGCEKYYATFNPNGYLKCVR